MPTTDDMPTWTPCDSPADLRARLAGATIIGKLHTPDASAWGYFALPDGGRLELTYADAGLPPRAVLDGDEWLVGAGAYLVCFAPGNTSPRFLYRMPVLFHEFVRLGDPLIVRDELGFVGLGRDGEEQWCFATEDLIAAYTVTGQHIRGTTVGGQAFSFDLPTAARKA